ncbi:Predicted hydrolase, HD superfamily [Desulfocicer vacuolatum DSM 3385]|uniref:Predicted hydrolase, HD superfamily n=1 Tax=Desulfocicer vacuolatum DSM 3385 TaxID=1121400 RepID=A0A1W2B193_9BACT|nr:hydrolase [Desulfocicer vacuolatum]SMC66178.1 Predicted hydrolase, HD superfamily [Desulfocicer vacuolatum DSM 3385]
MNSYIPSREDALLLFKRYNKSDSLLRHALSVEAVMGHFADKFNEDKEPWEVIGLVHDLDYEMYPHEHCIKCREILMEHNWPETYIRAVVSHGWGICSDVEPRTRLEKTLYAVDELTGLVASAALVRPSKSVLDLTAKSVKKKWKDKRFAAGVDRSIIDKGADMLGMDRTELITETISGMRRVAQDIGLKGNVSS